MLLKKVGKDEVSFICYDTLIKNKQIIVFCNSKRGAEAQSDKLVSELKSSTQKTEIGKKILDAISSPTKQCRRLAKNVDFGIAFHHSGLNSKQREIIEEEFKEGNIKIICATPTLAAGLDLPAFRVIIRDLKRFSGGWGMNYIPVLEYHQMVGRAGRPSFDNFGESFIIAKDNLEKEQLISKYVLGEAEDITSKLGVEPVLRTNILALICTGTILDSDSLNEFMKNTFFGFQYGSINDILFLIDKILEELDQFGFIKINKEEKPQEDFVSALKLSKKKTFKPTPLGQRVSELYLDPVTANMLITNLRKNLNLFGVLHLLSSTLEARPLNRVKKKEHELIESFITDNLDNFLLNIPDFFDDEYDDFLNAVKNVLVFYNWMDEVREDVIYDKFGVTPGELNIKLEIFDWLFYSLEEFLKLINKREDLRFIQKIRLRLKHGVKEEIIPLLKLKGIGRVRARKLYENKVKDLGDLKKIDYAILSDLLGKKIALDLKKQVGIDLSEEKVVVKKNKRKGQINLTDY